jgi:hypothetical protein
VNLRSKENKEVGATNEQQSGRFQEEDIMSFGQFLQAMGLFVGSDIRRVARPMQG